MPHYISLMKWTDEGVRGVKDSPKRIAGLTKMLEQMGGKAQTFFTMGEYDLVVIAEGPSDDVAMQVLLELGRAGNARTTTMRAWTVDEATKIIGKLQ